MWRPRQPRSVIGSLLVILALVSVALPTLAEVTVLLGYETRNDGEIEPCG